MAKQEEDSTQLEGFDEFEQYGSLFEDLTTRKNVRTEKNVVSMIISYDSKHAVAITSSEHEKFILQAFDIITKEQVFSKAFEGTYLKMSCIE